jgi:PKD repeat protein
MQRTREFLTLSLVLTIFSVFLLANPISAEVMQTQIDIPDLGSDIWIIRDLDNRKDFLPLDWTTPYSYNEIVKLLPENWRVATRDELKGLAIAVGLKLQLETQDTIVLAEELDVDIIKDVRNLIYLLCKKCINEFLRYDLIEGLIADTREVDGKVYQQVFQIVEGTPHVCEYSPFQICAIANNDPYSYPKPDDPNWEIWLVSDAPGTPIFDEIGNYIVYEKTELKITVNATDPDGDPLTYGVEEPLPHGAIFNRQTFYWEPTEAQAGNYKVTFTVSDGVNAATQTVHITVLERQKDIKYPPIRRITKKMNIQGVTKISEMEEMLFLKVSETRLQTDYDVEVTLSIDKPNDRSEKTLVTTFEGCNGLGEPVDGRCLDIHRHELSYMEPVKTCFKFDQENVKLAKLKLLHYDSTLKKMKEITTSRELLGGKAVICGEDSKLSPFFVVTNNLPVIVQIEAPQEPQSVDNQVSISASFTDADEDDTHTAECDWGDQTTSPGSVSETGGSGSVSCSHTYTTPGVYEIGLTVTDNDGGEGTSQYQYVVVYDPSAGFVTGGGWIYSPVGAYVPDHELAGKATFGFVSKYKKEDTSPTGNTEFQFYIANLNFHSESYEWLIVTGSNYAKIKGSGTINGMDDYKFMIWAGDEETDTFRIKIWEEDSLGNETVTYDNGFDQAIGGGSIVIHAE